MSRVPIFRQFFHQSPTRQGQGKIIASRSPSPSSLGQYNTFNELSTFYHEIAFDSTLPFVLRVAFPASLTANTTYQAELYPQLRSTLYRTIVRALHLLTGANSQQLTLRLSSAGRPANVWYVSCPTVDVTVVQLYQLFLFVCHSLSRGAAAELLETYLPGNTLNWFDAMDVARLLDEGYVAPWPVGTVNKHFVQRPGGLQPVGDYTTTIIQPPASWLHNLKNEALPHVNALDLGWTFFETLKIGTDGDRFFALLRERYHLRLGAVRDWFRDFTPLSGPAFCAALAAEFETGLGLKPLRAFSLANDRLLVPSANPSGSRDFWVLDSGGLWLRTLPAHPADEFGDDYGSELVHCLARLQKGLSTPDACGFRRVPGTTGLLAKISELSLLLTSANDAQENRELHSSGLVPYQLFRRACQLRGQPTVRSPSKIHKRDSA